MKATAIWAVLGAILGVAGNAYAGVAGHVQFVHGDVKQMDAAGIAHVLHKGDAVNTGDTLIVASEASAQIKMEDGGLLGLRSGARFKIEQFNFNGSQDGTEVSVFALLKGGLRAITGLIGQINKGNYRMKTPDATIGIRGTDHEVVVVTSDEAQADVPAGTYNKVNQGATVNSNAAGSVEVLQIGRAHV
jgi:hypothetical protein